MADAPATPALAALQELLYDLMTAPTGVAAGLAARGLPPDALDGVIAGDGRLGPVARLDIYANMYFFRILDVLRDEYPRVAAALGPGPFNDLVTDYLLAARPAHPSLREAGARLPAFLGAHARGAERPWLAEVAALERTHRELFDAADAQPLTLERLQGLAPEAFAALPVRLIPAHRVLAHAFAVSPAWERLLAESAPAPAPEGETLVVWRRDLVVRHRAVEAPEASLLAAAAAPTTLAGLCEAFAAARGGGAADDGGALAAQAFQLLARWVDDGLLAPG